MTNFLERVRRLREKLKERRILARARKGRTAEIKQKQSQLRLEEKVEARVKREETIIKLREVQAKRAKAEREIIGKKELTRRKKARKSKSKRIRQIIKTPKPQPLRFSRQPAVRTAVPRQQPQQFRPQGPVGGVLLDIGPRKGNGTKKKQGPTPGLGRFRVL